MKFVVRVSQTSGIPESAPKWAKKSATITLKKLPATALRLLKKRRPPFHLNIHLVDKKTIRRLNSEYREKNRPTDVLSFSALETPPLPSVVTEVGEIYICWPVVLEQAKRFELTPKRELYRLVVHGVLHVFGYDHEKSKKEERRMFSLQDKIWESIP